MGEFAKGEEDDMRTDVAGERNGEGMRRRRLAFMQVRRRVYIASVRLKWPNAAALRSTPVFGISATNLREPINIILIEKDLQI